MLAYGTENMLMLLVHAPGGLAWITANLVNHSTFEEETIDMRVCGLYLVSFRILFTSINQFCFCQIEKKEGTHEL